MIAYSQFCFHHRITRSIQPSDGGHLTNVTNYICNVIQTFIQGDIFIRLWSALILDTCWNVFNKGTSSSTIDGNGMVAVMNIKKCEEILSYHLR